MDNKRRDELKSALQMLSRVENTLNSVCDKEEDCMDNYPENLQGSERFEKMEDAVDNLSEALEALGEARSAIEAAIK